MPGRSVELRQVLITGAACVSVLAPAVASATETLKCTHDGKTDVTVSLGAREAFGQKLGCVEGPFVVAMTACAPKNGYGLSASSGDAHLIGVTRDWRSGALAAGPIAGVKVNPAKYLFEGGQLGADHRVKTTWTFEISRSTGKAVATSAGRAPIPYQCAKSDQAF